MSTSDKWSSRLAEYKSADNSRAVLEIAITGVPLACLWFAMWKMLVIATPLSYLGFVFFLVIAGGMIVRLFTLQHDCGHGAMFSSKAANDWAGRILGVFTYTPYDYWRYLHAGHHATSGDLDRRGVGDIDTLTIAEYKELSLLRKIQYRIYRYPLILFTIGPVYMFFLRHRIPVGLLLKRSAWVSTMATNVGIVLVALVLINFVGLKNFLLIQVPMVSLGAAIGVWMFYVQHQFDETYWDTRPEWTHEHAALHGSSYYALPQPFMWITGNIGIHHVHHLSSRIPLYKLPKVLKAYPELKEISRLTFKDSLKCVNLALWDDSARRLISFKDARPQLAA